MKTSASPLLLAAAVIVAASGCQPPALETTERIIRIQIEGCEDATPLPATPTPTPTPLAVVATQTIAPPTEAPTLAPVDTPLAIQTRVPRTPEPPARSPEQLADDFAAKRAVFFATLNTEKLHPLDVPDAMNELRRAEEFFGRKNYDEALRYMEVAVLQAQSVKMTEPFVSRKFTRVNARFQEARPLMKAPGIRTAEEALKAANEAYLKNKFKVANGFLFEVDALVDRRARLDGKPPR